MEGVIYQIDHTQVDVLVLKKATEGNARKSIGKRPWLTTVIDMRSRLVITTLLSFKVPDRHTVATVIRESIIAERGGIPDEIWVDNGKDLVSAHIQLMTKELGIFLHVCKKNAPEERGIIESFHKIYGTGYWSQLPGYVGRNVVERNPTARAQLTFEELEKGINEFVGRRNHSIHSELGVSPVEFWDKNCFASRVADIHQLDLLLLEVKSRIVQKDGIHFVRTYMHSALYDMIGKAVTLRVNTRYGIPDTVEVYHEGQWLCRAFAQDTEEGRKFSSEGLGLMQQRQMAYAKSQITEAKQMMQSVDGLIASQQANHSTPSHVPNGSTRDTASEDASESPDDVLPVPKSKPAKQKGDFLDFMIAKQQRTGDSREETA